MTIIDMVFANKNDERYGVLYRGANVHRIVGAKHNRYAPHRVSVWSNVNRPNPHPGETRWTDFGSIGGDGKYLDPSNKATDDELTVTTSAECTVITNNGTNTGTEASGQVYGEELKVGETVTLRLPNGTLMGPYLIAQRPAHDPHLVLQ